MKKWNFLSCATLYLVAREFHAVWQNLIFNFIIYIVQLCKKIVNIVDMLGCQAVAHPDTKQIVVYYTSWYYCFIFL